MERIGLFNIEKEDIIISMEVCQVGSDILVVVTGGDTPHIGAVTAHSGDYRKTLNLPHHKEYIVTESIAERVSTWVNGTLTVIGGIHIDGITSQQIIDVQTMCGEAGDRLAEMIKERFKKND